MVERKLIISSINPFSKRQEQIVQLRANGFTNRQVAHNLGISYKTVKNHISGLGGCYGKARLGVLGTIEKVSGERPGRRNWVAPLVGDILFFDDRLPKSNFVTKGNSKLDPSALEA